jgi:hypothetical protein
MYSLDTNHSPSDTIHGIIIKEHMNILEKQKDSEQLGFGNWQQ